MSGQHLQKRATFLTSEGNNALLPASARDQTVTKGACGRDQTVTKGGMFMMRLMFTSSARRVFQTVFFFHDEESYITNDLTTEPSGNSEFCFLRISMRRILGKQN